MNSRTLTYKDYDIEMKVRANLHLTVMNCTFFGKAKVEGSDDVVKINFNVVRPDINNSLMCPNLKFFGETYLQNINRQKGTASLQADVTVQSSMINMRNTFTAEGAP